MPSLTPTVAMRSQLDSQIGALAELSRKNFDAARRFNELHINLSRDLFDDFYGAARHALSSGDPLQLTGLLAGPMAPQAQPAGARLHTYLQQMGELLGGVQADLTRAGETLMPEMARAAQACIANPVLGASPAALFSAFPFAGRHAGKGAA